MIIEVTCQNLSFILRIASYIFKIIQWVIPILLIILITFDVLKVIINGEEKKSNEILSKIVKRFIYAIILFLIPLIVKYAFRVIGNVSHVEGTTSWIDCFNEFF